MIRIVIYHEEFYTFQLPMESMNKNGLALVAGLIELNKL